MDGFFLRVDKGLFVNNAGVVVISNSSVFAAGEGTLTNNGTLSGAEVQKEK